MSIKDQVRNRGGTIETNSPAIEGVVSKAPVTEEDFCEVVVEHFHLLKPFECRWFPRGISKPEVGDDALIIQSNDGEYWIINWTPIDRATLFSLDALDFRVATVELVAPITPVDTLPASPVNGQEVRYRFLDSGGSFLVWNLKYDADAGTTYKWQFIGGPPLFAIVSANQTTASVGYTDLGTVGPGITVPLLGDYDVAIGCGAGNTTALQEAIMSYAIGGTAAVDADECRMFAPDTSGKRTSISSERRKVNIAAATLLRAKYKVGGGTGNFENRWMRVTPARVG